jgi:hypothetical protein
MERTASDQLADHRSVWDRKPVLRLVYDDFYDRIAAACRGGLTIEIGGGIGNLKRRLTEVVATDIQSAPWLDCVADAHRLPFADACAANIVMVDVLHHLEFPVVFFREAALLKAYGYRICCGQFDTLYRAALKRNFPTRHAGVMGTKALSRGP